MMTSLNELIKNLPYLDKVTDNHINFLIGLIETEKQEYASQRDEALLMEVVNMAGVVSVGHVLVDGVISKEAILILAQSRGINLTDHE